MAFAHPLPWWALLGVAAAATVLAYIAYRNAPASVLRRLVLGTLRLLTLLLLVVLLMRPVARGSDADGNNALVPILVDTSRSMSIEDAGGARRIDRARTLLTSELLPSLSLRFRTEVIGFGAALNVLTPESLTASAPRSDLTGALKDVAERYRGRTVAGIVLLSDGGDTNTTEGTFVPSSIPVFAIGIGTSTAGRDREVLGMTVAETVLDRSVVDIAVSAVSHGHGVAPIELRLLENGRPVEVRQVIPSTEGTPVNEVFRVAPEAASPTVYTVEIPAAAGELVPENNTRSVLVEPPGRRRRILLVQGAPGFEHSFLQRAWSGDIGLEVDSVVRKGKNEQGGDTFYVQAAVSRGAQLAGGYPATRADLFGYDVVVLANFDVAALPAGQLEATRDFVSKRGGGLLVLGAQSFVRQRLADTSLHQVLPLETVDRGNGVVPAATRPPGGVNRVALTADGEEHPIMQLTGDIEGSRKRWQAVPALASISPLGGARPGASVLAVATGAGGAPRALIAVQRYGAGRSMVFTGEGSWRWRMMLPAQDKSYDTFWRQAVRWLALPAAEPVSITAPASATPGDLATWRVAVRDKHFEPLAGANVEVHVTAPDGTVESLPAVPDPGTAGIFVARHRPVHSGIYRATADVRGSGPLFTTVPAATLSGGSDAEMTDPRLNLQLLEQIATASGGRIVDARNTAGLAGELRAGIPAAVIAARRDLWHNGWSFTGLVLLLAGEWLLRRRWGLR